MIIYPFRSACWFGGLAQIGMASGRATSTWYNGTLGPATHELGHNFGLAHSQGYECTLRAARGLQLLRVRRPLRPDGPEPEPVRRVEQGAARLVAVGERHDPPAATARTPSTCTTPSNRISGVTQVVRIARPDGSVRRARPAGAVRSLRRPHVRLRLTNASPATGSAARRSCSTTTCPTFRTTRSHPARPCSTATNASRSRTSRSRLVSRTSASRCSRRLVVSVQAGTLEYHDTLGHSDSMIVKLSGYDRHGHRLRLRARAGCRLQDGEDHAAVQRREARRPRPRWR